MVVEITFEEASIASVKSLDAKTDRKPTGVSSTAKYKSAPHSSTQPSTDRWTRQRRPRPVLLAGPIREAARPTCGERSDGSSVGSSQVGAFGVLRSALLELDDDRICKAAQEEHVAFAQLGPLLVGQTAEHVQSRVEGREGNADVGTDASGTRNRKLPQYRIRWRARTRARRAGADHVVLTAAAEPA